MRKQSEAMNNDIIIISHVHCNFSHFFFGLLDRESEDRKAGRERHAAKGHASDLNLDLLLSSHTPYGRLLTH